MQEEQQHSSTFRLLSCPSECLWFRVARPRAIWAAQSSAVCTGMRPRFSFRPEALALESSVPAVPEGSVDPNDHLPPGR